LINSGKKNIQKASHRFSVCSSVLSVSFVLLIK
jgi:hypothetical protein